MNGFIQFFKNLCYLSKFSLKEKLIRNPIYKFSYEDIVENILYYIPDTQVIRPNILDRKDTIHLLVNSNLSLARFGDGELSLAAGHSIPHQAYNKKLADKIIDILKNKQKNLLVGINHWYFYCEYDPKKNNFSKQFELEMMPFFRKEVLKYINLDTIYCNAGITGFGTLSEAEYNEYKKIWNNKDILIVTCQEMLLQTKYNIYDNAKHIDYIFVPNKDSYSEYKPTLDKIKTYDKNTLIILMAGPLSKVLASDLANIGYRALDLGHLMKSYDYYRKGIDITSETVKEFFKPDEKN